LNNKPRSHHSCPAYPSPCHYPRGESARGHPAALSSLFPLPHPSHSSAPSGRCVPTTPPPQSRAADRYDGGAHPRTGLGTATSARARPLSSAHLHSSFSVAMSAPPWKNLHRASRNPGFCRYISSHAYHCIFTAASVPAPLTRIPLMRAFIVRTPLRFIIESLLPCSCHAGGPLGFRCASTRPNGPLRTSIAAT
jgi:hypothetical protein